MSRVFADAELDRHAAHRRLDAETSSPLPLVADAARTSSADHAVGPTRRRTSPAPEPSTTAHAHSQVAQLSSVSARRTTRPVDTSSASAHRGTRSHEPTRITGSRTDRQRPRTGRAL